MLASFKNTQAQESKAISSGYMNNCGLNSLIHLWLNLPEEHFIHLFNNFPIFQEILNEFCEIYGVKNNNLQTLLAFKNLPVLKNPWDKELIWGEAFRRVLRNKALIDIEKNAAIAESIRMVAQATGQREEDVYAEEFGEGNFEFVISSEQELAFALSGRSLDWRLLRLLTQEMGLTLTVKNCAAQMEGFASTTDAYEKMVHTYAPKQDGGWSATLFFNGYHYDFTYGNSFADAIHNSQRSEANSFILKGLSSMLFADEFYQQLKPLVDEIQAKPEAKLAEDDLALLEQFNLYQREYLAPKIHELISKIYMNVEKMVGPSTSNRM